MGSLVLIERPQGLTKVWFFLLAPVAIWISAGIMGPLRDLRLKLPRPVTIAAVVVGMAVVMPLVKAIQIVPNLPKQWALKGPVENTVLWVKDRLQPNDLIIIDAPEDAQFWYYSHLYGLADSRFNQRLPFQRLFVIVYRGGQQTRGLRPPRPGAGPGPGEHGDSPDPLEFRNPGHLLGASPVGKKVPARR